MAEIVNLRQVRKRTVRRNEEAKASENRTTFGMTKAERRKAAVERERAEAALDGRRLDGQATTVVEGRDTAR